MKPTSTFRRHRQETETSVSTQLIEIGVAVLVLLALAAIAYFGMVRRPIPPAHEFYVASDVSASNGRDWRKRCFSALDALVEDACPVGSTMHFWRFDSQACKVDDLQPEEARDLWRIQDEICNHKSKTQGTHPAKALQEMLAAVRQSSKTGQPVMIVLLWDGGDDDPVATQKAVRELAALPQIKVLWIVGVKVEQGLRSSVERTFAPFQDRLIVSSLYGIGDGLERLRTRLQPAPQGR